MPFLRVVRHARVPDLVPDLHPPIARRRHREEPAQQVVCPARHDEAAEEVEVVQVRRPLGHLLPNRPDEPDDVDQDPADVRRVPAPGEPKGVVVGGAGPGGVQVADLKVALADEVVVADDDAGDGGEEDGVGGEVGGEVVGGGEEVPAIFPTSRKLLTPFLLMLVYFTLGKRRALPRTHGQPNCSTDIPTPADIQVPRQQRSHICARRHGIGCDVGPQLREGECSGDDEHAKPLPVVGFVKEHAQQVQRIPDGLAAKDDGRGRRNDDPDKRSHGKADGNGEELRPKGVLWLSGEPCKIRVIHNQSCKIGDAGHDTLHHRPTQIAAGRLSSLLDNGPDAVGSDDGPDEEGEAGSRDEVRFHGEKVADLVHREPDGREGEEPEEKEGEVVASVGP